MAQLKFYRVETLPETGEVGSLYFVYKGTSPKFYVCTSTGFEQYSDLFSRNFSTSLTDAIANSGDGVVYFTTDTHLIVKDGVIYGTGADLTGYATEQWVEDKGYLTEHQDISGKVNVADFEEATFVTSAALIDIYENKQDQSDNALLTTSKTIVGAINELASQIGLPVGNLNIDLQTTEQDALVGDLNIIYFTTDTNRIIYQGKIFSKEGYVYDASLNSFSTNTASAQGKYSHAEGYLSETGGTATSNNLSAGEINTAGAYAHAEGNATIAKGASSHSEGQKTFASGIYSHAEGYNSHASGDTSHAEGFNSHAEGNCSHAEGEFSHAEGESSHAEGEFSHAIGQSSHAEGYLSVTGGTATSNNLIAGTANTAGAYAHAEGNATIAKGIGSHSEGQLTFARGNYSHAEGMYSYAEGESSHAECYFTRAAGKYSHAEGYSSETGGTAAANTLTAGTFNTSGAYAHAEGNATIARGIGSHSEGQKTFAFGDYSHAEGSYTITENNAEHAEGKYNKSNSGTISSIGIGESENSRKNAVEVMQNGDTFIHGVGGYDGTNINTTNIKGERFPASIQEVLPKYNKEKRSICFHYNETDGSYNQADADYSFVTGYNNKAHFQQDMLQAGNSFVGGDSNDAYHQNTFVFGKKLFTQWANTFVLGKYNATVSNHNSWGDTVLGVVGDGYENSNGTVTGRNVLLLQGGGDPALHCRGSFKNNASWINDFGEYFEWLDGNPDNEDRIGYMVQLNGDKIEFAESFEKCIGVISGTTGFIGGVCAFEWHHKFLHDKWGREIIGEDGNPVINPDYNPELEYIPREQRKEWDVVGLVGQVITRQDGTLEVGGYASCNNGIATKAPHGFKVLKIIDSETALLLVK